MQEENFHEEVYFLFLLLKLRRGRTNNMWVCAYSHFNFAKGVRMYAGNKVIKISFKDFYLKVNNNIICHFTFFINLI